ncbi:MAG: hypothetical protein M9894_00550 [Planctomycetes bacterium]|nr:hypothetical protein [Planctomycetota bacterium]
MAKSWKPGVGSLVALCVTIVALAEYSARLVEGRISTRSVFLTPDGTQSFTRGARGVTVTKYKAENGDEWVSLASTMSNLWGWNARLKPGVYRATFRSTVRRLGEHDQVVSLSIGTEQSVGGRGRSPLERSRADVLASAEGALVECVATFIVESEARLLVHVGIKSREDLTPEGSGVQFAEDEGTFLTIEHLAPPPQVTK